jgi:hypothetical protein
MDRKNQLIDMWLNMIYSSIGIDRPANANQILTYVRNDLDECADPVEYNNGDVSIAFRRFLESCSDMC